MTAVSKHFVKIMDSSDIVFLNRLKYAGLVGNWYGHHKLAAELAFQAPVWYQNIKAFDIYEIIINTKGFLLS